MTVHYHGTPITPSRVLRSLAGRSFCVSYAHPHQVEQAHVYGESVMLDNGAFTTWTQGKDFDIAGYQEFARRWLDFPTTWAVIADVIGGTEEENDLLIAKWPRDLFKQSAPVWHTNESLQRLDRLCRSWDRVCIGSSAEHPVGSGLWHRRMDEAFNHICKGGRVPTWIHMLRGMAQTASDYPFASVDSTDVGRNHNRPQNIAADMAQRWGGCNCSPWWTQKGAQLELA